MTVWTQGAVVLRMLVNCLFPLALLFSMTRLRCSRRTAALALAGVGALAVAVNCLLFFTVGQERMMQVFALVMAVPSVLFLIFAAKDRPSQIVFNFFTVINVLYLAAILGRLALGMREDLVALDALLRAVLYGLVLWIFHRWLNRPYHFLADHMKAGWRVIALVPFLFFVAVMFLGLYPRVRTDNFPAVLLLYAILAVVYAIIYTVFRNTRDLILQRQDNQLLMTQVHALQHQVEAIARSEDRLRIFRHDLRHYHVQLAALLGEGDVQGALGLIDRSEEVLAHTRGREYCAHPMLNAILCFYLARAEEAGIETRAACDIPEDLPVDALELSAVLANAIENACQACGRVPDGQPRWLHLRCVSHPQFVFEVANTYAGDVCFGADGLPLSGQEGHGIGTRSMAAFAGKHHALLDYKAQDGVFRVRLLLNLADAAAPEGRTASQGATPAL